MLWDQLGSAALETFTPGHTHTVRLAPKDSEIYNCSLYTNGGTIQNGSNQYREYTYGVGMKLPDASQIIKEGHTFAGWYKKQNFTGSAVTEISANEAGTKLYYAKWIVNKYSITFNAGDGEFSDGTKEKIIEVDYGTALVVPEIPELDGKSLKSWDPEVPATMPAKNMTVTAVFCDHSGNTNKTTDNGDGNHSFICTDCGTTVTNPHTKTYSVNEDTNTITASCDACLKIYGKATLRVPYPIYFTNSSIFSAGIANDFENGEEVELTYVPKDGAESEDPPVSVGKHTAKLTVSENGDVKASVTAEYEVTYLPTPQNPYSISGHSYYDETTKTYWFKDDATVTVNAPEGYKISKELDGNYEASVSFSKGDNMIIYLEEDTGAMTDAINVADVSFDENAPTGKITVENRGFWEKLLNKITFGLFFKGDAVAEVEAQDIGSSGVSSIQYYVANEDLIGDESLDNAAAIAALEAAIGDNWETYDKEIALKKNDKNIIYVKITDNVGNVTYISSNGIVLYSDAKADTESVSATYKAGEDKDVTVELNGNTVKSVANGTTALAEGTDYTVSDNGIITLKASYLDTLIAGTYTFTVSYNPLGETYVEAEENDTPATTTFTLSVAPASIGNAAVTVNGTFTYDGEEKTPDIEVELNGVTLTKDTDYTVSYADNVNAGAATVTVSGKGNYKSTATKTFDIEKKEISISWGATSYLTYTGSSKMPKAEAVNLVNGDSCTLTTAVVETDDGAGIIPGIWTAEVVSLSNSNYKLPANEERVKASFEIVNGYQNDAPDISALNETINGKADGKIIGVDSTMEYRAEGETTYIGISGTEVTDLAVGVYYVRYAAKTYYNPSPEKQVTISSGRNLTVTVPQNQIGYTLKVDKTEFEYMGGPKITLTIADGYSKTENFAVKINGKDMQWGDFTEMGTQGFKENAVITVEGIADITPPDGEISIKENKWSSFWNDITLGLFFNETQDVTITAEDSGSDVKGIEYYLSDRELQSDELGSITEWQPYEGTFKIDPNNFYIIYAKITDNAGNVAVINSDGITLDNIAPTFDGIEDGQTYYGDLTFAATDALAGVKEIKVDGNAVTLTEGKCTITADNADHTVTVTDNSGNSTEWKITVYKQYTITFMDENGVYKTLTVKHGEKVTMPDVPTKDGYTVKWDKELDTVNEDVTVQAVYTEIPKAGGSSPDTGDNSNMFLWIALLFISGGAIVTLTVVDRKRKSTANK